ncbi:MAG: rubredoxin [Firmicutes bacterium]|uniref:Rubredoxin n=1 Tax=Candidatus Onthovivens merdipullorum TaxID=2840889 RepID=A0A9D9DHL6_9BACL|nr:rubredoxin [Candidatus Onthovivens merdipullorum]
MKYYCKVCGITFESDDPNPICPVCGASGDDLEVVTEENKEEK